MHCSISLGQSLAHLTPTYMLVVMMKNQHAHYKSLTSFLLAITWLCQTANIVMLNAVQIMLKFSLKWRGGWHKDRDCIPPHFRIIIIVWKLVTEVVVGQLHGLILMITLIKKTQTSSCSVSFLIHHSLATGSHLSSCEAGVYDRLSWVHCPMIIPIFHSVSAHTVLLCQASIVADLNCLRSTIWNPL